MVHGRHGREGSIIDNDDDAAAADDAGDEVESVNLLRECSDSLVCGHLPDPIIVDAVVGWYHMDWGIGRASTLSPGR